MDCNNANQSTSTISKVSKQFVFHHDAGHGWLEVPYQALVKLGIEKQITCYSYQNGYMTYLEEDLDAPLFIRAYLKSQGHDENDFAQFNEMVTSVYHGGYSFIRGLNGFK